MTPYVETALYELVKNIQATTDVKDMTIEEIYLLLKEKIKEKQIPAEIYWDPERLDPKSLWILDISALNKPVKIVHEGYPTFVDLGAYEIGVIIDDPQRLYS